MMLTETILCATLAAIWPSALALDLDINDPQSIRDVAQNLSLGVLSYYQNYNTSSGIEPWQVGLYP